MKCVVELIEKECLLLILNVVTSLRCWWSVALYVQTTIWYDSVPLLCDISKQIFVMLGSIVIVKSMMCVQ
jgi:hypothetical protein